VGLRGAAGRGAARRRAPAAPRAALALARKRRLGPFGREPIDRARREKQLAAMLRAGHRLDTAREIVDAASEEAAEQWAEELDEEA
jgi:regulatory protein